MKHGMKRPLIPQTAARLAGLVLSLVLLFAAGRIGWQRWLSPPDCTLFVHSANESRDPAVVIASVLTGRESAWNSLRESTDGAEKLLWMERVDGELTQRLFGSYSVNGGELTFTPASPLVPGGMYHIVYEPAGSDVHAAQAGHTGFGSVSGKGRLELIHQVPANPESKEPGVVSVHPGGSEIPANHLKFYITFTQPMEQGVFLQRILLLRRDGGEIAGPFRETELWSPDEKRLTVWLHPGRQKTGVNLNEDEGPVLREGDEVTLVIRGDWRSAAGRKLGSDFKRSYRVGKADHEPVDPARWKISAPKAGTRDPLRLFLFEPLDWALLQNSLRVSAAGRSEVGGRIDTGDAEREWRFTPQTGWQPGEWLVSIKSELEDLAGNNLGGPFEVDVSSPEAGRKKATTELRFEIR